MNAVRSDSVDFFLGTTTPAGFKGYFEPLRREPGMQMYLIKSGPGCGKSTLMKRLAVKAEQKGEPIQRIHCASDPDSLDGVMFLDYHAADVLTYFVGFLYLKTAGEQLLFQFFGFYIYIHIFF